MRAMPIQVFTGTSGVRQMKAAYVKNKTHYLQEALGIAIFMISACFFGAMLEGETGWLHLRISNDTIRTCVMGLLM